MMWKGASIVGVSALLTTTMAGMKDVVTAIHAAGLGDVKVIVGGAPVTADFAAQIGGDRDAARGVRHRSASTGIRSGALFARDGWHTGKDASRPWTRSAI